MRFRLFAGMTKGGCDGAALPCRDALGRALMALLETRDLTAFYGDFQALFGISLTRRGRARRSPSSARTAPASRRSSRRSPACCRARPDAIRFDGDAIGGARARPSSRRGIALVPEGRRLFPSLSVEENLLIGGYGRRGRWTLDRVYELFPILAERRAPAGDAALRRPAADVRHRPRADGQPAPAPLRRDQPRPGADRHPRHLRGAAGDQGGGHERSSSSSRTSCRRWRSPTASTASRRAA